MRLGRLDLGITSDPVLALSRGEARARLQQVATEDDDRIRRSRATNLVGVIAFASSLTEARDQAAFVQDAAAAFQTAIELDPDNREAKANLELALQRGRALQPTEAGGGPNPSPGGSGAKGAGAGDPGSGYYDARLRSHLPLAQGGADRARHRRPAGRARARRPARQPPARCLRGAARVTLAPGRADAGRGGRRRPLRRRSRSAGGRVGDGARGADGRGGVCRARRLALDARALGAGTGRHAWGARRPRP